MNLKEAAYLIRGTTLAFDNIKWKTREKSQDNQCKSDRNNQQDATV